MFPEGGIWCECTGGKAEIIDDTLGVRGEECPKLPKSMDGGYDEVGFLIMGLYVLIGGTGVVNLENEGCGIIGV